MCCNYGHVKYERSLQYKILIVQQLGRASLVFMVCDVTRFAGFLRCLVQKVFSLIFDPMLHLFMGDF